MFGSAPWFNNASIATSQFLCWAAIIKGFVWNNLYSLSNIDQWSLSKNTLVFPNISRVENHKNRSGRWLYQSVSPSLRVPRSKSAPSLINTSIIAFIDFLKFIHHYIISDSIPFGNFRGHNLVRFEFRLGLTIAINSNIWLIWYRLYDIVYII